MKELIIIFLFLALAINSWTQDFPHVNITTELGIITLEIDTVNAPVTAGNFLKHVEAGTFINGKFYRVVNMDNQPHNDIKIEVIQGGLFEESQIARYPSIRHESTKETGLKHLDGTISVARNSPGTASTEFFICIGHQPELDFGGIRNPDGQGFAAFGRVVNGMDVVRKVQQQPNEKQYLVRPVKLESVKRRE